jgi:hypothetical protein
MADTEKQAEFAFDLFSDIAPYVQAFLTKDQNSM